MAKPKTQPRPGIYKKAPAAPFKPIKIEKVPLPKKP